MKELKKNLNGIGMHIAIVQSRFNSDLCEGLLVACRAQLVQHGVAENDITLASVPSVRQIPLVMLHMSEANKFDALIAIGAVVRGDRDHFKVLSTEPAHYVDEVQLECGVPIANAILTTDTYEQALERMHDKGSEAALVAIEMVNLLKGL